MNELLLVALVALASHRLTRLVTSDRIGDRPRNAILARLDPDGLTAYLVTCSWCAGFWVAGLVTAVTAVTVGLPVPLLVWPATATVVGLLATWEDR